jgi:hypothetical protein
LLPQQRTLPSLSSAHAMSVPTLTAVAIGGLVAPLPALPVDAAPASALLAPA